MHYDEDWLESTMAARKAMVRKTIRPASIEELKALGEELFPVLPDPWADKYHAFLAEHKRDRFFLAEATAGSRVVYCKEAGRGFWYIPGKGMGIIQANALEAIKEIADEI